MSEGERSRAVALSLMRMALALLDRHGNPVAAARLQYAIDTEEEVPDHAPSADRNT